MYYLIEQENTVACVHQLESLVADIKILLEKSEIGEKEVSIITMFFIQHSLLNFCSSHKDCLKTVCSAYYPSQQHWRGYSNAAVRGWLSEWVGA